MRNSQYQTIFANVQLPMESNIIMKPQKTAKDFVQQTVKKTFKYTESAYSTESFLGLNNQMKLGSKHINNKQCKSKITIQDQRSKLLMIDCINLCNMEQIQSLSNYTLLFQQNVQQFGSKNQLESSQQKININGLLSEQIKVKKGKKQKFEKIAPNSEPISKKSKLLNSPNDSACCSRNLYTLKTNFKYPTVPIKQLLQATTIIKPEYNLKPEYTIGIQKPQVQQSIKQIKQQHKQMQSELIQKKQSNFWSTSNLINNPIELEQVQHRNISVQRVPQNNTPICRQNLGIHPATMPTNNKMVLIGENCAPIFDIYQKQRDRKLSPAYNRYSHQQLIYIASIGNKYKERILESHWKQSGHRAQI